MEYFKQPNKTFFNQKEEEEKTPIRLVRNRGSPIRASDIDDVVLLTTRTLFNITKSCPF
jgi:hypothetical protein